MNIKVDKSDGLIVLLTENCINNIWHNKGRFLYETQVTKGPSTSLFDYYAGAITYSKVTYPNETYYHWSSENTDYELRLGIYKR